jgi:ABC-type multidrug transport system ATPase subunit
MFIDSLYIQRMIGVCCQFDLFWEEMTVLEIISFFGRLKGINYIEKIQEKITLFGLNGKQKEYVSQLSGGMRRRLSLLISILGDPFILYLDEPTTGLDPVNRRKIWKIIDMLKKNKVLLLSTQNMEEADFLCDKVGVLMNGKLMFIGTCHEILQKNLNANFGIELQITVDNFDLDDNKKKRFEEFLKENFNKSKINVSQSGLYVIQIKNENKEEIKFCMEMVNKKSKNEKLNKWFNYIKEVVISQANLEKAFIDLCHIYQ